MNQASKNFFKTQLKDYVSTIPDRITSGGEWDIRGFVDIHKNIYSMPSDTKVISKVLELHLFPLLRDFAEKIGYDIEVASYQNWYPDFTLTSRHNSAVKFALDLKTTYRDEKHEEFCNGFTLGSHGEYFTNRTSAKNIQYPYGDYSGHFCLGVIYSRALADGFTEKFAVYNFKELEQIPAVIKEFTFFAEEKWKIASDKSGSGNTANIGSIKYIDDLISGNGVFSKAGESLFDDYWINFGKILIQTENGGYKKISNLSEYLNYRGLDKSLNTPEKSRKSSARV